MYALGREFVWCLEQFSFYCINTKFRPNFLDSLQYKKLFNKN